MTTITIDELKERLDEVIDRITQGGEPVAVVRDGVSVIEMMPSRERPSDPPPAPVGRTPEERAAFWAEWDRMTEAIGRKWPKGASALEAVLEQRREL